MKVEPLSGREKNIIVLGITVAIIALLATYLFDPYWEKYNTLKSDFQTKTVKLADLQKEAGQESANKKQIEEARKKLREIKGRLPDHPANAELLFYINRAAAESAVTLEIVVMNGSRDKKSAPAIKEKGMSSLPVEITVSGPYPKIRIFTQKIQELKRVNRLSSVELTNNVSKVSGKLVLQAFFVQTSETDKTGNTDIPTTVLTKADPFI